MGVPAHLVTAYHRKLGCTAQDSALDLEDGSMILRNEVVSRFAGSIEGEVRRGADRYWIILRGDYPLTFSLPLSKLKELENEIYYRLEKERGTE
jgi:hypothetical protein